MGQKLKPQQPEGYCMREDGTLIHAKKAIRFSRRYACGCVYEGDLRFSYAEKPWPRIECGECGDKFSTEPAKRQHQQLEEHSDD